MKSIGVPGWAPKLESTTEAAFVIGPLEFTKLPAAVRQQVGDWLGGHGVTVTEEGTIPADQAGQLPGVPPALALPPGTPGPADQAPGPPAVPDAPVAGDAPVVPDSAAASVPPTSADPPAASHGLIPPSIQELLNPPDPAPPVQPAGTPPLLTPEQAALAIGEFEIVTADLPPEIKRALIETGQSQALQDWYDARGAELRAWHERWGEVIGQGGQSVRDAIDRQAQDQIDAANQRADAEIAAIEERARLESEAAAAAMRRAQGNGP